MSNNKSLNTAIRNKNDEFYTLAPTIEAEVKHYKAHFKNKVVYCNCDDPRESKFYWFFREKFDDYKLKKIITTCYKSKDPDFFSKYNSKQGLSITIYDGKKDSVKSLAGDGDFRSGECIELLKESDIVCTNPPFSLFREYIAQLIEYKKKFLIIGNINAITYKETFPLIKNNKIWLGCTNGGKEFLKPDGTHKKLGLTCWYSNLPHKKRNEELILTERRKDREYPKYDNYKAINVDKTKYIPKDYDGEMGVPITFLERYNPQQFKIIDIDSYIPKTGKSTDRFYISGKRKYARIIIKRKK